METPSQGWMDLIKKGWVAYKRDGPLLGWSAIKGMDCLNEMHRMQKNGP